MSLGTQPSVALALVRARHALGGAGLDPTVPLERVSSVNNEVWLSPEHAVRINRHHDRRLGREAQLVPHLPAVLGYPEVVAVGSAAGFDWLVARRRPGAVLARCWPSMSTDQRRRATAQLAEDLRALHATPCPPGIVEPVDNPQLLVPGPQPEARLLSALARAGELAHVDRGLVRELTAIVVDGAPLLGTFEAATLVHGDLTFENVLWDGSGVSAVIDFEWCRAAPPDVDLDVLLRFCAYPFLHVADDYADKTLAEDYADVPWWLRDDYPELFFADGTLERLRIYGIGFDVRELLAYPPAVGAHLLSEHHPLRRLARIAAGTSHLDALAAA